MDDLVYVYDRLTMDMCELISATEDKSLIEHWNRGWQRQIDEILLHTTSSEHETK